jgi:hypothetical protein
LAVFADLKMLVIEVFVLRSALLNLAYVPVTQESLAVQGLATLPSMIRFRSFLSLSILAMNFQELNTLELRFYKPVSPSRIYDFVLLLRFP